MYDSGQIEKGETGEEHGHHFLQHQGDYLQRICPGRPKQSIPHTTVTFYGDCV
jgi:hypothetical protein